MAHPIRAGQDMNTPQAASNSAHLCSHPHLHPMHAHQETEQREQQGHGQHHPFSSAAEHTHVHTGQGCTSSVLAAREGTNIGTPMQIHRHACTYTPVCNYAYVQMQTWALASSQCSSCTLPAPCKSSWCGTVPRKSPAQVPRSPKPCHWPCRAWGLGNSTTQHRQQYPTVPHPMPAWHSPWCQHWL